MATYSTYATAKAAALANADYRTSASLTKAKAFAEAVEALLLLMPAQAKLGARHEFKFELQRYQERLDAAYQWIGQNPSGVGGGVRAFSLENFRV